MSPGELTARALQIADESMVDQLECHGVSAGPTSRLYGLASAEGTEVRSLADADPAIVEAFEWLQERGLVELIKDDHGECIQLREIARVA